MSSNQIHVIISMGDGYQVSDRLRTAVTELGAALEDVHGDDTSGFTLVNNENLPSFTYQKIESYQQVEWTWVVGSPLKAIVSPRDSASGLPTGIR